MVKCTNWVRVATGIIASWWILFADAQTGSTAFRELQPESVGLAFPSSALSAEAEDRLANRFVELVLAEDPVLAVAAFDLLRVAPRRVIDLVRKRLEAGALLDDVIRRAPPEIRSRFGNSQTFSEDKLLNAAPSYFLEQLDTALNTRGAVAQSWLAALARGFRHLPDKVAARVFQAIDNGALKDQPLDEWMAVLKLFAADLSGHEATLRKWLAASEPQVQRDTALQILLQLGFELSQTDVERALRGQDQALVGVALEYLRNRPDATTGRDAMRQAVQQILRAPDTSLANFRLAHTLMSRMWPNWMTSAYASGTAILQGATPLASIEWIRLAPATSLSAVAALPLHHPNEDSKGATCEQLRYELAVLTAMAEAGKPTLPVFWSLLTGAHNCFPSYVDADIPAVATAVDRYLSVAGRTGDLAERFSEVITGPGVVQLGQMQLRSSTLGQLLENYFQQRLAAGDWIQVSHLVQAGARADTIDLSSFWSRYPEPTSALTAENFARIALSAGRIPLPITLTLARLVADGKVDAETRVWAMIALSATENVAAHQQLFVDQLSDKNDLVVRAAMGILGRAYAGGLREVDLKNPDESVLTDLLLRGDTSFKTQAQNYLAHLARYGDHYARLFVVNVDRPWPDKCVPLLSRALTPSVGLHLLNTALLDQDVARACAAVQVPRSDALAEVALNWTAPRGEPTSEALLRQLQGLWQLPAFSETNLAERFASIATQATARVGYMGTSDLLGWWIQAAKEKKLERYADQIQFEKNQRSIGLWLIGIPVAVLLHLSLWFVLLCIYPRSAPVQAIVFWNPIVRKLFGLGYIDLVLLYVRFARVRLFAPFKADFLRHLPTDAVADREQLAYYTASLVERRDSRSDGVGSAAGPQSIVEALSASRGRVLLLGKSGLGKSSFLRFWLSQQAMTNREVMVYLRADECRHGVTTEINRRMKAIGSDQNLVNAMLYAGRLSVFIDGYNEVDIKTQDEITAFLGDFPRGNILVTSQIPLRGFASIVTYELLPLSRTQSRDFLTTRAALIPVQSAVSDALFLSAADGFLSEIWSKAAVGEETKAFDEVLSNPMDLTSVAMLLAGGTVPDLFALESQQFETVKSRLWELQQLKFRTEAFSSAVLEQRLQDQEDLALLPFKPEVTELVHAKLAQIKTFADSASNLAVQEVRFRHDRIRDYFTHFALLESSGTQMAEKAADARFSGVFRYLARAMPKRQAEEVRERLIQLAADMEDHRVSDSFIREYGWRQRLALQDPEWLLDYDLADGRLAEMGLDALKQRRQSIDAEALKLRDRVERARQPARLLAIAESSALLTLGLETLRTMGASVPDPDKVGALNPLLRSPSGIVFALATLAQEDRIRDFHVNLLAARIADRRQPLLLLINGQVIVPPDERAQLLSAEAERRLHAMGAVVTAEQLYAACRAHSESQTNTPSNFWSGIEDIWRSLGHQID